jgi:excisionase family DNA binding protein
MANTISYPQACLLVGVSEDTLRRWVRRGLFPAPIRIGPRTVRFRRGDVKDFIARTLQGQDTTSA